MKLMISLWREPGVRCDDSNDHQCDFETSLEYDFETSLELERLMIVQITDPLFLTYINVSLVLFSLAHNWSQCLNMGTLRNIIR